MQVKAKELALMLNGQVEGDPEVAVSSPSKIEEGGPGTISFLGNLKYEPYLYTTTASVVLVGQDFEPKEKVQATLIKVENVYSAIALLLEKFQQSSDAPLHISDRASVHEAAILGDNISIGDFAIVEAGASIGSQTRIAAQVYIGRRAKIGSHVIIYPGARILDDCVLGDHCIIHSNVVIGSDGFGFAPQEDGSYRKIAQIGNVVLEDHVEVGANTCIDRATMGSTIIRSGVKLDNLIQIAHNVEIKSNTVIAAQTGIAGSTKIGASCMIGGQVGFVGHISVADSTSIQAQTGVASSIKESGQAWFGTPAIKWKDYLKSYGVFKRLTQLDKELSQLSKKVAGLAKLHENQNNKD